MTIATEVKRVVQVGTGSTPNFTFNAPVDSVDALEVFTLVLATGVQTKQTRGGSGTYDYTVTINSATKFATITLNNNLPTTHRIVILRDVAITQQVDYVEGDPFPAETHEGALDKLTTIATMLSEQVDRSLKVVESSATTGLTMTELVANKALVVNSAGTGVEMGPTTTEISAAATAASNAAASESAAAASATSAATSASTAQTAQQAINLPTLSSTYVGYYIRVNSGATGYEFISPPQDNATFYGFKFNGSTLQYDKSVIGQSGSYTLSDYRDYDFGAAGLSFSINASGHLVATFP
jgi:hypothetical protein|tara:strand:+ start:554 stop:1444 length:891 start_codon:yes stop_codon:yes gene_type:complete